MPVEDLLVMSFGGQRREGLHIDFCLFLSAFFLMLKGEFAWQENLPNEAFYSYNDL